MQAFLTILGVIFAVFVFGVVGQIIQPVVDETVEGIQTGVGTVINEIKDEVSDIGSRGRPESSTQKELESEYEATLQALEEVKQLKEHFEEKAARLKDELEQTDFDVIINYDREEE